MDKPVITITTITGRRCELRMPTGGDYSRASRKFGEQKEFDVVPFLMAELCVIDGEKRDANYYTEMYCDDYIKIMEQLGSLISVVK